MSDGPKRKVVIDLKKPISAKRIAGLLDNPKSDDPNDRWSPKRALRWMLDQGIGRRFYERGPVYTTYPLLRAKFEWIADLYVETGALGDDEDDDDERELGAADDYG